MLSPGTQLGPYRLQALVGAGGMGEVYRALDTRLDREVAIKVLPEKYARDAVSLARFKQEAKVVAALDHPNILVLHDVGTEAGVSFAVTELLKGESLRQRLAQGALPRRKALEIGAAIADGLAAAHDRGVIHRDLKPENVFLTSDERTKVLDFGLARLENQERDALSSVPTQTAPGTLLGTFGYMAPEQVRGERADARSDIFSLGCTLYEMVTGRKAFARGTAAEGLAAVLQESPRAPSIDSPGVGPAFDRVVMRCLAKRPEERFQSSTDLAFALRELLGEGTGSERITAVSDRQPPSIAVLPFANLSADPEQEFFCDGAAEEIIHALAHVQNLRVVARTSSFAFKGRAEDVREIGRRLEVTSVLEGSVRKAADRLRITAQLIDVATGYHLWSERFDRRQKDIFAIQDEIAQAIVTSLEVKTLGSHRTAPVVRYPENLEAHQAYLAGLFEWNKLSPEGFARCQELYREAMRLDPRFAPVYARLADCLTSVTWWADQPPVQALEQALPLVETALSLDADLAHAHSVLGVCRAFFERDWRRGERSLRRAVELAPNDASSHTYLGLLLVMSGRPTEAVERARCALRLDPLSPTINVWAAVFFLFSGQAREALSLLERQITMTPHLWMPRHWHSVALTVTDCLEEARAEAEKALALSNHGSLALYHLACLDYRLGERQSADRSFALLQRRSQAGYVAPTFLAWVHLARGEVEAALRCAEEALAAKDPWVTTHRLHCNVFAPPGSDLEDRLARELPELPHP